MLIDLVIRVIGLLCFAGFFFGIAFGWHWTRCVVEDLYQRQKDRRKMGVNKSGKRHKS